MRISFDPDAWEDYVFWQQADSKVASRINLLIREITRNPFRGTGKPEPLGRNLAGWWSRRIDREHRVIYRVTGKGEEQTLEIIQCRFHY